MVLLMAGGSAPGLRADHHAEGSFLLRNYSVRDGLVQNQPNCLFQDRAGRIWIGTLGGISCYDGYGCQNYSMKDGLPSSYIQAITEDNTGQIWAGTYQGVALLQDGRFVPRRMKSVRNQPKVHALAADTDGAMLVATDSGLFRLTQFEESHYTTAEGLPDNALYALLPHPSGDLYLGTERGICVRREGRFVLLPHLNRRTDDPVRDIFLDRRTGELLLTRPGRLTVVDAAGETSHDVYPSTQPVELRCAVRDWTGVTWISSSSGLLMERPDGSFRRLAEQNGFDNTDISKLLVDYENNLWATTGLGVAKLSDRSITVYSTRNGLSNNIVWSIQRWNSRLVVSTESGFQFLYPDIGLGEKVYLPQVTVTEVQPVNERDMLLGTDQGVYRFSGETCTPADDGPLQAAKVYKLSPLPDGGWLVGTDHGLFSGRFPRFQAIELPGFITNPIIYDIMAREDGTWWLCLEVGILTLHRRPDGQWHFASSLLLEGRGSQCLLRLPGGDILVGTIGAGIYRWDGRRFTPFAPADDYQGDHVWCLYLDAVDRLWVGTSRGISYFVDNKARDFNDMHGLPHDEITNKNSIFQDITGAYYFCSTQGLIQYTPARSVPPPPPRVRIERIEVNQAEVPFGQGILQLDHDSSLNIDFRCLSFLNESGNRFQFMLDGVDDTWGEPTGDHHVYYPYLPLERTTFRLRALNSQGFLSDETIALTLHVTPPFTQTVWFLLIIISGIVTIIVGLFGYKNYLNRREREKLEQLVAETTAELTASEQKHRLLVEASPSGIAIIQDNRFVFVNPQLSRMLGYPQRELVGREVEPFVCTDDLAAYRSHLVMTRRHEHRIQEFELRLLCGDDSQKSFLVRSTLSVFERRPALMVNLTDLTEQKRMQEQLIHYQKLESIGTLAGGVAHDFNNILQGILGHTSLLRLQMPAEDVSQKDISMIEEAAEKAAALTKKLLGFARRGKYVVTWFSIRDVVDSVIALSRRTIPLKIEFEITEETGPLFIQGDRSQFEQVLLNLFLNSRDAMPDGGRIEISIGLEEFATDIHRGNHVIPRGQYLKIMVEDTGPGIPADIMPRIFDPFFTTKPHGKGSGLGLANVYGIIKNHQGFIYFDHDPAGNGGARATMYIPNVRFAPPGATLPLGDLVPDLGRRYEKLQGRCVLIAEDDSINRDFLNKLFQKMGMRTIVAEDGARALFLFAEHQQELDAVLLDVNMPVMDGRDAVQEIFARRPDIPVVILSGYGHDEKIREMLAMGCRDFIQKPVEAKVLLSTLENIFIGAPR